MMQRMKSVRNLMVWIHVVLMAAGFYALGADVQGLSRKEALLFSGGALLLMVPLGISWVMIRKVSSLGLFLAGGAFVSLILFYVAEILYRGNHPRSAALITGILSIIVFVIRGYVRIKKGRLRKAAQDMPTGAEALKEPEIWEIPTILDEPSPLHWLWFVAEYITGVVTRQPFFWHTVYYLFFADVFVCFFCSYTGGLEGFILEHRRIANLPVEDMKKAGKLICSVFLIFLFLLVVPSAIYRKDPLAESFAAYKPEVKGISGEKPEEEMLQPAAGMDLSGILSAKEGKTIPEWLEVLFQVLMYLTLLVVALAVLRGVYRAVQNAGEAFSLNEEDEVLFLHQSRTGNEKLERRREKKEGFLSPNRKIRRYYKKTIRKSITGLPQGSETPQELEKKAGFAETTENRRLHSKYEKARYSREGCTREEADTL